MGNTSVCLLVTASLFLLGGGGLSDGRKRKPNWMPTSNFQKDKQDETRRRQEEEKEIQAEQSLNRERIVYQSFRPNRSLSVPFVLFLFITTVAGFGT